MIAWLRSQDRNDLTYWLGLVMLFAGLGLSVSAETALIVVLSVVQNGNVVDIELKPTSSTGSLR